LKTRNFWNITYTKFGVKVKFEFFFFKEENKEEKKEEKKRKEKNCYV